MFQEFDPGDAIPTTFTLPTYRQETLRHILLGDYGAIVEAINQMTSLGYCVSEACPKGNRAAWSNPIPSGRSGEYIAVLTRRGVSNR